MHENVPTSLDFVEREKQVLEFWKKNKIFEKTIENRKGKPIFTFYDGPPTANGKPHIGHVLTRAVKDLIPRYRTMKGYQVLRKAGWDTHGLPVEVEVEKELGLSGKPQIEQYGIEPFIERCKKSVWKFKSQWEELSERVGFWADMENPYITYDDRYIESIWWSLKVIFEKGLLYKGHKVVPYCPRCGTSLSSHEVAQGYKDVEDASIIVRFRVKGQQDTYLLAWTTTPWTLPSNVALCVNADEQYARVRSGNEVFYIAAVLAPQVLEEGFEVLETFPGSAMLGMRYEPLYDYAPDGSDAYRVVADSYVTLTDGSGIVHTAPAFGEDDARVGRENGLPFVQMVDAQGAFVEGTPWEGQFVKQADPLIIEDLKSRGLLFAALPFTHSYPFCWRCDTPLLYYARSTWFIRMTAVRDALLRCNREINWIPANIRDGRMGNFLENVVDWGLSRERYWGTPLPVWECECGHAHVIGSREELIRMGRDVPENIELHKPFIDAVTLTCPRCGCEMRRVPEVIDCWYDSGSMPFAQWHYPFENEELFEQNFPADFISEAIDQTRGWFYSLLAISTLLFNEPPYRNCIVLGLVNDMEGRKMSKHLGNVVDPWDVLDRQGADAVRWYFYVSSAPWLSTRFSGEAVREAQRKFMGTLWNTYAFYVLYANIDGFHPAEHTLDYSSLSVMDRWILSRLSTVTAQVDEHLMNYRITEASRMLAAFVDELSNWYVRRGRERYWGSGMTADKIAAYMTLYTVLETVAGLAAPFVPFIAEMIYRNLVLPVRPDAPESVHLTDFPVSRTEWIDTQLEENMAAVLDIVTLGRACRNVASIKNRQPTPGLYVQGKALPEEFVALIADELNVKSVRFVSDTADLIDYSIKPQMRTLGPRLGKLLPALRASLSKVDGTAFVNALNERGGADITVEGQTLTLSAEDVMIETVQRPGYVSQSSGNLTVVLDTNLTDALRTEGFVREVISKVQNLRREAGFSVTDHIRLYYAGDAEGAAMIEANADYISSEVLADAVSPGEGPGYAKSLDINGRSMALAVEKIV
ncbi:MAG: isoleucine--tRNA ligase [Christensenellales bacterium]